MWAIFHVIFKNQFKKEFLNELAKEIIISFLFIGLPLALISSYLTEKTRIDNLNRKITQTDKYNFGVACLLEKHFKNRTNSDILIYYEIDNYPESFDFVNQMTESEQDVLLQNIVYMTASNKMLEIYFVNKNEEIITNTIKNTSLIKEGIRKYNKSFSKTECY